MYFRPHGTGLFVTGGIFPSRNLSAAHLLIAKRLACLSRLNLNSNICLTDRYELQLKQLSSSAVPQLRSVEARGGLLPLFVPGRPVETVICHTCNSERLSETLDPLRLSLGPVVNLTIHISALTSDSRPMNDICAALPFLRDLRIVFETKQVWLTLQCVTRRLNPDLWQRFPHDNWFEALLGCRDLRRIHVCQRWWEKSWNPDSQFFEDLRKTFPHIEMIF